MVPAKFVYLDSFPLTHNGKVDRKALPAPVNEDKRPAADSAQPRTATEEAIAAIWMEMFKIDHVGIHDDFFDLGGHSLLAIKVMSRIRDVLGVDLPVLNLFENPTIAALAADVAKAGGVAEPQAEVVPVEVPKAPVDRQAPQAHEPPAQKEQETRKTAAPYYFGTADSALFGVYAPPSGSVARQAAVLLCAPIGAEYMRTHYAVRLVSTQLARAGFHTLRFDYHGTGDSSGNVGAGQFDLWADDIALAAQELIEKSGVKDLTVVGLRMGAALAVEALASQDIDAQGLVLWDPVVSGGEYLAAMEKLHSEVAAERKAPLRKTDELFGFRFPQDLRAELQRLELADRLRQVEVKKAALVVSEDLPQYGVLLTAMRSQWPDASFSIVGEPAGWNNLKKAFEGRMTGPIVRAVVEAVESLS